MATEKEKLGDSISFEAFESEKMDHISKEEAAKQESIAEEVRGEEGK